VVTSHLTALEFRVVMGLEFCAVRSHILQEAWVADFACSCCQKARCGRAFLAEGVEGKGTLGAPG
jgi:hypothetical protein